MTSLMAARAADWPTIFLAAGYRDRQFRPAEPHPGHLVAAAEDWVAAKALAVLAGDSARAAAEITAEADAAGLAAAQRTGADACVRYLTGKDEYLRYDHAPAAGWPIATGSSKAPAAA